MDYRSITEVADACGCTLRALRFYEEKGLLAPVREGTRRLYDDDQVARAVILTRGRACGLSLESLAAVLKRQGKARDRYLLDQLAVRRTQLTRDLDAVRRAIGHQVERTRAPQ